MKKEHKQRKGRRGSLGSQRKQQHPPDWVPIQVPEHLDQMFQHWVDCEEPNIGWCLICDNPIRSVEDLIPGTNTHDCAKGRDLDEKIRLSEAE